MSLVNRITTLAKKNGYSIRQIELNLNFSNGSIRRWDTNEPSCYALLSVANFLKTSMYYLLTGNERETTSELSTDEKALIDYYRNLDPTEQQAMFTTLKIRPQTHSKLPISAYESIAEHYRLTGDRNKAADPNAESQRKKAT